MTPKSERRFYVYTLSDPRCGNVFYVGKGQGKRVSSHVADWRRGNIVNQAKHDRIGAIMAAGLKPVEAIVWRDLTEGESFRKERDLIAALGRKTLTNNSPGADPLGKLRRDYQRYNNVETFGRAALSGGKAVCIWAEWMILAAHVLGIRAIDPEMNAVLQRLDFTKADAPWAEFMAKVNALPQDWEAACV